MTLEELSVLRDIIKWAKLQVKTDGMYIRIDLAEKWIDRDIRLKTTDFIRDSR